MRIGILGGTFDPVHNGHLRAAENAAGALDLERVEFVPAGTPPHREPPAASALDRYAMVALATSGRPAFVPSDREVRREGPSYTVDTVRALREENPGAEIVLIVGGDNLHLLPTWKDPEAILGLVELAVVGRPGGSGPAAPLAGARVRHVAGTDLPIASRDLRARLKAGGDVRGQVPAPVADYIAKRRLYR